MLRCSNGDALGKERECRSPILVSDRPLNRLGVGTATVGTIGYEGRTDDTAIGSVVNWRYGSAAMRKSFLIPFWPMRSDMPFL